MTALQQTLENFRKGIKNERKDNILNHVWTILSKNTSFVGEVTKSGFKIWKYNGLYDFFHPIIIGQIIKENNIEKLSITTKYNSFGRLVMLLIVVGYLYGVFIGIEYRQCFSGNRYLWDIDWSHIASISVFPIIMTPIFRYLYNIGKKEDMQQLRNELRLYSNSTNQDYF
ncbi:hypothetical protein [Bernardetia sp.]|uniref:hypothetical protein n=1 Tax=Bernardetia sp. TaxID=1937974 RepID=UPI0025B8E1FB|nr:hypothetical protein [Bernardetia sp.]